MCYGESYGSTATTETKPTTTPGILSKLSSIEGRPPDRSSTIVLVDLVVEPVILDDLAEGVADEVDNDDEEPADLVGAGGVDMATDAAKR